MIVIAVLGLLLPGYCVARALDARIAWAVAFPLSALLLTETVIAFAILGVPIRFGYVLGVVGLVSLSCFAVTLRRSRPATAAPEDSPTEQSSKLLRTLVGLLVLLVTISLLVRTSMYPLSGDDTPFRWDALPRLMLQHESLSYYPPATGDDFAKYIYPDGLAPLVATVYWWLYAAWGRPWPALTSVSVLLQLASCFALTYDAAKTLFGRVGGALSLAALCTSLIFLRGVGIGQETGFTAIAYAGQLAFALRAGREPRATTVALAGLFAALGALAREYGPLLALCGFVVLVTQRNSRRYVPLFCLIAAVCAAPWYVRNWERTGNPIYPVDIGLGFALNPVYSQIVKPYQEALGLSNYSIADLASIPVPLVVGAPLILLPGLIGIGLARLQGIALGICTALAVGIWISAVGYTSGGLWYTVRVLTPACVVLSIGAGAFGGLWASPDRPWKRYLRGGILVSILLCGGLAVARSWSFPDAPTMVLDAIAGWRNDPMPAGCYLLVDDFENFKITPSRVLTDDLFVAIALQRTRFQPVMVWSPEVAFVFDPKLGTEEIRHRLIDHNIGLVLILIDSPNNKFLMQSAFYRDDGKTWPLVWWSEGNYAVFSIRPLFVPVLPPP